MVMALLAGCNTQTRDEPTPPTSQPSTGSSEGQQQTQVKRDAVELTLLVTSSDEKAANVVRDQLKKAGFNVTVNVYPDSGTFNAAVETEEFDMAIRGYSGAGSPDANIRGPFHSNGAWNTTGHNDSEIDALIDEASRLTGDASTDVYKQLEQMLVEGKGLAVPMFSTLKTYAVNKNVVDAGSIETSVGGARWVWSTKYNNMADADSRPYVMGINWANPNSFDCVQGRDGTTYYQRTNINVPLIQCAMGGVTTTRGSLTKTFTTAEGNMDFYFLLRTDINFGTTKNGKAVDTGLPVSAEDVKSTRSEEHRVGQESSH